MAVKWWADEDVEAAVPWAWPFILDAIKAGDGVASERALSDARLVRAAGLDGVIAASGRSILDKFIAVGLVVDVDGGLTARSWSEYQRQDESKRERQRRWREKRRLGDVSETSRDDSETQRGRRDDVSETATVQYSTVHDSTSPITGGGSTTPRVRAVEPPPTPTPAPDGLADVCEAFRLTQQRGGMFVPPATVQALSDMTAQHGAATVKEAIARGHESARGGLTLAYLRPVVEAVARGEPRGRPVRQPNADTTGRHTARSTDEFGPRPLAPGEL
jgi:hypothetical protein